MAIRPGTFVATLGVVLVGVAVTPVAAHATKVSSGSSCFQDVADGHTGVVSASSGCIQVIGDLPFLQSDLASILPATPTLTTAGNSRNLGQIFGGNGSQQYIGGGGANLVVDNGPGTLQTVLGFGGVDANFNALTASGSDDLQVVTNLQPTIAGSSISAFPFTTAGCIFPGGLCANASRNLLVASGTGIQQGVYNGSNDRLVGTGSNIKEVSVDASNSSITVDAVNAAAGPDNVLLLGTPSAPLTGDSVTVDGTGDTVIVTESGLTILIPAGDNNISCVNTACP